MQGVQLALARALARSLTWILRKTGHQATTLPGRIVYHLWPGALAKLAEGKRVIMVTGTNGKTTTTHLLAEFLRSQGRRVASNEAGANLRTGLLTTFLLASSETEDYVLEVDEGAWASCAAELQPQLALVLNLFRDQLDRYGETATVQKLLLKGLQEGKAKMQLLCADDPLIRHLALHTEAAETYYFGHQEEAVRRVQEEEGGEYLSADKVTTHCPCCQEPLSYRWLALGHLGNYFCTNCHYERPLPDFSFQRAPGQDLLTLQEGRLEDLLLGKVSRMARVHYPLRGTYNEYNACAALAAAYLYLTKSLKQSCDFIALSKKLEQAQACLGRQEILEMKGRRVCFLLSKNPVGLEESLRLAFTDPSCEGFVLGMNSRLADGKDMSWIWDVPFEYLRPPEVNWTLFGERRGDVRLRCLLAQWPKEALVETPDGVTALGSLLERVQEGRMIYVIANYTAMMDLRHTLEEGRKGR